MLRIKEMRQRKHVICPYCGQSVFVVRGRIGEHLSQESLRFCQNQTPWNRRSVRLTNCPGSGIDAGLFE